MIRPLVIAGPTASGKSALALRVAERDGGCIVNADALQVYDCWGVLTARPGAGDLARAPHRLYGHVPFDTRYSVGTWLREIAPVLDDLSRRALRPIIVGGTGLYLSALTEGLTHVPEIPPETRARSQALLDTGGPARLIADLQRLDPAVLERLDRANPRRVQRAWEVATATERGLSEWQRDKTAPILQPGACDTILVCPEKATLDTTISRRFRAMLESGALEECRAYLALGGRSDLPSGRALGAPELCAYLEGTIDLETAISRSVIATRQFAKRQRTWFASRMRNWTKVDPVAADPLEAIPPP